MARFSNGASDRLGKRSRNVSETASLSSWGSEVNVLSDTEEGSNQVEKRRRVVASGASPYPDHSGKAYSSSDDESQQPGSFSSSRGKKPKCFSRNAVLARQNRLKKKKYVEDLENELQTLRRENSKLKVSLEGYSKDVQLVRKENLYLRNVLANSKELSQLLRSINVNFSLPASSSTNHSSGRRTPPTIDSNSKVHPKVTVESAIPALEKLNSDSCVPTADSVSSSSHAARTVKKDYPIAVDDVSLSLSAPEDEDDLDKLFGKDVPVDLDFNLNEATIDDTDYLGFGPNALGDWLDGDEPLADIGVCLHVAKKKVSLEFCSSCNESAFSNWNCVTV